MDFLQADSFLPRLWRHVCYHKTSAIEPGREIAVEVV